ncbi:MAG: hypothetical protein AB9M53_06255, partial [Leptothrix sp. (in: b-proteobacteria)]
MNARILAELDVALTDAEADATALTPALIAQARAEAGGSRAVAASDWLAQQLCWSSARLVAALAHRLSLPWFDLAAMAALQPAFDRLSYAEASARGCVALLDAAADELVLLHANPFDDDLQAWCDERLGLACTRALASADDIAAYLARHEDSILSLIH